MTAQPFPEALNALCASMGLPATSTYGGIEEAHLRAHQIAFRKYSITEDHLEAIRLPALVGDERGAWHAIQSTKGLASIPRLKSHRTVIELYGSTGEGKKRFGWPSWWHVHDLLTHSQRDLKQIILLSIMTSLVGLAAPQSARLIMGTAIPDGAPALLSLATLATLFASLWTAVMAWVQAMVQQRLRLSHLSILQRKTFARALALPYLHLTARSTGELSMDTRPHRAMEALINLALAAVSQLLVVIANMGILFWTSPSIGAFTLTAMVVIAAFSWGSGIIQIRLTREATNLNVQQQSRLNELVAGMRALRASGALRDAITRWKRGMETTQEATLHTGRLTTASSFATESTRLLVTLGTALVCGALALQSEFSIGTTMAVLMMSSTIIAGTISLVSSAQGCIEHAVALRRYDGLLAPEKIPPPTTSYTGGITPENAILTLRNVGFRYTEASPWVLRHFDLTIHPGESVWIKGPSGRGKTTLLRAIAGLMQPQEGQILLGGVPVTTLDDLSKWIAYLPQEARPAEGSIWEALVSISGSDPGRIHTAAERTGLAAYIQSLPMGYETRYSAHVFSGGQKQWLAITAALASPANILLLDEPQANMDWDMRRKVSEAMYSSGKTIVQVSHDAPGANLSITTVTL